MNFGIFQPLPLNNSFNVGRVVADRAVGASWTLQAHHSLAEVGGIEFGDAVTLNFSIDRHL